VLHSIGRQDRERKTTTERGCWLGPGPGPPSHCRRPVGDRPGPAARGRKAGGPRAKGAQLQAVPGSPCTVATAGEELPAGQQQESYKTGFPVRALRTSTCGVGAGPQFTVSARRRFLLVNRGRLARSVRRGQRRPPGPRGGDGFANVQTLRAVFLLNRMRARSTNVFRPMGAPGGCRADVSARSAAGPC